MIEFFKVIENVWCIRRPSYLTCSYIINTSNGLVFIDASMDSHGRDIQFALKKLGATNESIKLCILTHWHNDHSSGADYIEKVCNRPIYCHNLEKDKLVTPNSQRLGR